MSLTAAQIKKLNRANKANQDAVLGTKFNDLINSASATTGTLAVAITTLQGNATVSASHTVSSAEATASRVVLTTGLAAVTGFIGQELRSGSPIINARKISGSVAGTIEFKSAYSGCWTPLAENDVVSYIAW